ncbi:MAG: 3-isopropylmalate dehydratase [Acidobacteria bacterium]|nr:3-isopropylmalate dehydratase [Acidobacteriota bacterium]
MAEKQKILKGRIWLMTDENNTLIDDIDTDMIFHNAHLAITDIKEMGQHAFGNLKNWKHFPKEAKPGDIVMAGRNFGSGSSRQQAVDCFPSLGVTALICESYGAIYKRNAINSGFPIVIIPGLVEQLKKSKKIKHLQNIEINLETGIVKDVESGEIVLNGLPLSPVQIDIYNVGGLLNLSLDNKG